MNQHQWDLDRAEDLLRVGDPAGWALWESSRAGLSRYVPKSIPEGFWPDTELRGPAAGTVIVLHEGGAGDAFMAARFAQDLAAEGARVWWQTPPAMAPLFRTVRRMSRVLTEPGTVTRDISWVRAMSLPARYGGPGRAHVPYMRAGSGLWTWLSRRKRVALRTTSGPHTPGGVNRDLPLNTARWLEQELERRGYEVVSLYAEEGTPWSQTARLITSCRAVISVDTGVAHLAGALGVDLRVLLSDPADWRWGEGARTEWYPQASLHRAEGQDWRDAARDAVRGL